MEIREMRKQLGITQQQFADRYNLPFRTVQNWEIGVRNPPNYIIQLLENQVKQDLINRKTLILPKYDPKKIDLPKRENYIGTINWLKDVKDCLGEDIVFALDEALMCQGYFNGHSDEFLIWIYGPDSLLKFNGVVILSNHISKYDIEYKNGLSFTNFNRTINDAFANEEILDMQGIIEAASKYYYKNNESFDGISVSPKYQFRFEKLAEEAIDYYND